MTLPAVRIEVSTDDGWAAVDGVTDVEISYGRDHENDPPRPTTCVLHGADPALSGRTVRVVILYGDTEYERFVGSPKVA